MKFKPTDYRLVNVGTGKEFEDAGWSLADPQAPSPSLVRAVYENEKFTPRDDLKGLYRYAEWLPVRRTLRNSHAPVTYKSKGLADLLGMENLYITLSGYVPKRGARMETCSFKETEAFSVCARLPKNDKRVLVVQSAGHRDTERHGLLRRYRARGEALQGPSLSCGRRCEERRPQRRHGNHHTQRCRGDRTYS